MLLAFLWPLSLALRNERTVRLHGRVLTIQARGPCLAVQFGRRWKTKYGKSPNRLGKQWQRYLTISSMCRKRNGIRPFKTKEVDRCSKVLKKDKKTIWPERKWRRKGARSIRADRLIRMRYPKGRYISVVDILCSICRYSPWACRYHLMQIA